jgi:hypothetical protein
VRGVHHTSHTQKRDERVRGWVGVVDDETGESCRAFRLLVTSDNLQW